MSAISSKGFRILGFASTWKRPWSVETIKEAANAAFLNFNAMQGHYQWFMSSGVRGAFAPANGISSASASQRHHSRCQASFPLRNTSADTYTIWGRRPLINAVKNTEKTQQIQPNKKASRFREATFIIYRTMTSVRPLAAPLPSVSLRAGLHRNESHRDSRHSLFPIRGLSNQASPSSSPDC